MSTRRLWTTLLIAALSGAGGFLVGELVRDADEPTRLEIVRDQAARIQSLEDEVIRLEIELREARSGGSTSPGDADPELAGAPGARPPSEVPTPVFEPAPAPPGAKPPATLPVAKGGMLDVLRALSKGDVKQTDTALVDDGERAALLFGRTAEGPTVRAEETTPEAEVEDGTTIVLDAGVYDYSEFSSAHRGTFPADVTFRGIGKDRTLLVVNELGATGAMQNLGFEDLTLDTRGHYLADVRGDEPISLRFERVRVIGFDQSPGGAVLLAARYGAVLARDTSFEAGFGNAPGTGSFFHVRGPFLVRFERCTIVGPFKSLYEKSERAAYAYVQCRFEKMPPERRRDLETPDANVRLVDCQVEYLPEGSDPPARRSRAELNPAWRSQDPE